MTRMMTQADAEKLAYAFAAALADEADMDALDALVEKHAGETVTLGMLAALVFPMLVGANAKSRGREKRIKQIEERRALTYVGAHQAGQSYHAQEAVTHQGSLWIAHRDTTMTPGTGDAWQLAAKRGRDGKDLR